MVEGRTIKNIELLELYNWFFTYFKQMLETYAQILMINGITQQNFNFLHEQNFFTQKNVQIIFKCILIEIKKIYQRKI